MHCVDGRDVSVFSILPPYNNLRTQVIRRDTALGKLVSSGVSLSYESTADATGSINTSSAGKTNFWTWAAKLFGLASAPVPNIGLAGNPTASLTPAAMAYDAARGWWGADGIPILPYDDSGAKNYYPMVKVVARGAGSQVLASTRVVLPVSDEMSCKTCHASTGSLKAAMPAIGWVSDPDIERDWKLNILRKHDEMYPDAIALADKAATYTGANLEATARGGQPILCANCHQSNALGTPKLPFIRSLTRAVHALHADAIDPATGASLESNTARSACYNCHPGSVTKCLRGVMGNAVDAAGKPVIDCQSCHGSMSAVASASREGWLDEPACQNCHDRDGASAVAFSRFTSVFLADGVTVRPTVDRRFATSVDVPAAGRSLYRYSTGHGGLQCEACHGATHAEYPSSHANDNVQSLDLQGHTGTIRECEVCHAGGVANATNGGPHGMHIIGTAWVSGHKRVGWSASCAACHGADARGTALSRTAKGQIVGCYNCHNGPNGGD
jgi:hypothetical protein